MLEDFHLNSNKGISPWWPYPELPEFGIPSKKAMKDSLNGESESQDKIGRKCQGIGYSKFI